jgi:hypothetical protein
MTTTETPGVIGFAVICPDNEIRHGTDNPFPTRDAAERWTEWGHICMAAAEHTILPIVDVIEVAPDGLAFSRWCGQNGYDPGDPDIQAWWRSA